MSREYSEKVKRNLKEVVDHFDKEDRYVRERQLRQWKKLKYYWNGFQRLWWSEVAHDWRVFDVTATDDVTQTGDSSFYDKPVNIFKAYLESIIAALSITIPAVKCFPDNAENALDLDTAKAGDKIAKLIYRHNDVSLLWLHALYIYCTEGLIACYNYTKEDESFGTYEVPKFEDVEEIQMMPVCPLCGTNMPDAQLSNQERDEFDPGEDDVAMTNILQTGQNLCPNCLVAVDPELRENKVTVTRMTGKMNKPKARQCLEVYGGLFVKVPNYAMKQSDMPYLIHSYETHYSNVVEQYPELRNKFSKGLKVGPGTGGMYDPYERWARLSTQYFGEYPINNITVKNAWIRPSGFNILQEEDAKELKKLFPNGVKVILANDEFCEAENECLDDHWTLTHNPLSDYLHHDPLGLLLTSVQEITNDLVSLVLQTIEHGIPQTFADPAVLDFEAYRQTEAAPGMIYPAIPKGGKSVSDAFYEIKTSTLSGEVLPFGQNIQEMGQLVSGALPSLFGGEMGGSKTAAQYSMSRAQALQRLQTPWKMLMVWWKQIFAKVIPAYIKDCAHTSSQYVEKNKDGDFINVLISESELQGKLGDIELEASEQLPVTWAQQKDVIMQLLQAGNPQILEALMSPENAPILREVVGLDNFVIPGEDDREKQYDEIRILLNTEPIAMPTADGMGIEEVPAVDVEPLIDNNELHADICRRWAVSPAGRLAKVNNPEGYKNVLLHMQRHINIIQAMMTMNAANAGQPQQEQPAQEVTTNGQDGSETY